MELNNFLNFNLINIENKNDLNSCIKGSDNFIIITKKDYSDFKNQVVLSGVPLSLGKLIEKINLGILKYNFSLQSNIKLDKYLLNLNSRELSYNNKIEKLTEQEVKILTYLKAIKEPVNVDKLQREIWGFKDDLETHTVETHIHRLRKKISNTFDDKNLIISTRKGYKLNNS